MNINLTAPTQWSDLNADQFRKVVEILLAPLSDEERLLCLFCALTGVQVAGRVKRGTLFVTADGRKFTLKAWELEDFSERQRWLVETEPDYVPNPTKVDEYLRDMSFGDWYETDTLIRLFEADNDLGHFDAIRPKLGIKAYEPASELDATVIRLWWNWAMGQIQPRYPNVFVKSDGEGKGENDPFKNLQDLHLMLNDGRPQDNTLIDEANVHDVLSAIDYKIDQSRKAMEMMRKGN